MGPETEEERTASAGCKDPIFDAGVKLVVEKVLLVLSKAFIRSITDMEAICAYI